jgi:hypothetical protein
MGDSKGNARRIASRVIAAVAVTDMAYRLFMRAAVRRALGIEVKARDTAAGGSARV